MARRQQGWFRVASLAMVAAATLLLLISLLQRHFDHALPPANSIQAAHAKATGERRTLEPHASAKEMKAKPNTTKDKRIYAGVQIENIYNLSIKDRVFMAEGWYWLKWPEAINAILEENDIPQEKIIEFTNQVEASSMVVETD